MTNDSNSNTDLRIANERLRQEAEERKRIEEELKNSNMRMRDELQMAAEFQQTVLPKIVDVPYLKTCLVYRPFASVSGDIYDFLLNREKELAVFLGDATGHGIAAALMTMMVHLGLDSLRRNLPTDESMRRLNQLIASRETGRSVTAIFFRVTPGGMLTVTHAGHPSLVVIPADSEGLVQFNGGGCALGLFKNEPVPYEEEAYQLSRGDKLFAYTDAVIEWRDKNKEIFGLDRLLEFLSRHRECDIQQLSELLQDRLKEHAHGVACDDDLTVLTFEYLG